MNVYFNPARHLATAALMAVAALCPLSQAWAQAQGAGALFEGRPAMAGAQGGQGAQAGMPQGGLGVQGAQAEKGLNLRKPSGLDAMPPLPGSAAAVASTAPPSNVDMTLKKDAGAATVQRSGLNKAQRAAKTAAKPAA